MGTVIIVVIVILILISALGNDSKNGKGETSNEIKWKEDEASGIRYVFENKDLFDKALEKWVKLFSSIDISGPMAINRTNENFTYSEPFHLRNEIYLCKSANNIEFEFTYVRTKANDEFMFLKLKKNGISISLDIKDVYYKVQDDITTSQISILINEKESTSAYVAKNKRTLTVKSCMSVIGLGQLGQQLEIFNNKLEASIDEFLNRERQLEEEKQRNIEQERQRKLEEERQRQKEEARKQKEAHDKYIDDTLNQLD